MEEVGMLEDMCDAEGEDPSVVNRQDGDGASVVGPAGGAGQFRAAAHAQHPDGRIPLAALPGLFGAAGLTASAAEVEVAMHTLFPEARTLSAMPCGQCQEVYHHLHSLRQNLESQMPGHAKVGCVSRWMATDTGATNLLLIIVVSLCGLSAFLAAGVAILLLFLNGLDTAHQHLQENLGIFQDTLEVFAGQIVRQAENSEASTMVTTLSTVLRYIGYIVTQQRGEVNLLGLTTALSKTIASWMVTGPDKGFVAIAVLAAALTNASLARHGLGGTQALLDALNAGLPDSHEVMLARWRNGSGSAVEYLTQFRFVSQCPDTGCITNASVTRPMMVALAGNTLAQFVMDYTGTDAFAGFANLSGFAVEAKVFKRQVLQRERFGLVCSILQVWTAEPNNFEFIVAQVFSPGVGRLLVLPNECDTVCQETIVGVGWPMHSALMGQTGVTVFTNHRGEKSLAAYIPVDGQPLALVVQVPLGESTAAVLTTTVSIMTQLNTQYARDSQEFELSTFDVVGDNATLTHLTPFRFGAACPAGKCVETPYARAAVQSCSEGVLSTTDYRGRAVLVGYSCIRELNAVVSVKVDVDDYSAESLHTVLEAVDARTAKDTATSAKFLLATPRAGLTAGDVMGYADFEVRSKAKYPSGCAGANCTLRSVSALHALKGLAAVVEVTDYRNVAVTAAVARSTAVSSGMGLALEIDSAELRQPLVDTALKVVYFTVAMVVFSTLLLVLVTKVFLRSMIRAKEEGHRAVEVEKDRFSRLVSSMYPAYVLPRLLEGQKQMVCEVPGAAVFFSDIHEFTSASNGMASKDLLLLMGYVYGVMDRIADHFGVYKVKTIGDAYLAVHGLPGTVSTNTSLDLLRFASCVCQVFGDRFVHPTEGQVLAAMNKAMQWTGRPSHKKESSAGSVANPTPGGTPSPSQRAEASRGSRASVAVAESVRTAQDAVWVQCIMSYGLAVGKLVAGVLAGRCPMFDVWGTTVNLASRMQSTGEPGRIQVSEKMYHRVMAVPDQPFTFDPPRSILCKGFGTVHAYLVRTTAEGLPKDLQEKLALEPRYGAFYFENFLPMGEAAANPQPADTWAM
eukprot:EG_transcript_1009